RDGVGRTCSGGARAGLRDVAGSGGVTAGRARVPRSEAAEPRVARVDGADVAIITLRGRRAGDAVVLSHVLAGLRHPVALIDRARAAVVRAVAPGRAYDIRSALGAHATAGIRLVTLAGSRTADDRARLEAV